MLGFLLDFLRDALGSRPGQAKRKTPAARATPRHARLTPEMRRATAARLAGMMRETAAQNAHWRRERAAYEQDQRMRAAGRQDARGRAAQPVDLPEYCDDTPRMQP